jgi:hypothetical protein
LNHSRIIVGLPYPDFVASYTNTAPDQVASDDGIAAIVLSIDMTYTVSLAAIARINVMLASMGSSSAADNTIMGGKTAQKKPSAVDELNDVDPKIDPDL